ncbi:MAG: GNAT family N-acetyltransferase [Bacteriovorax sp.]
MKYEVHFSLNEKVKADIEEIYPQIFEIFNPDKFFQKFEFHTHFLLLLAYDEDCLVGFKFGYGQDPDLFYSWTGGVKTSHRKRGIATELMNRQHEWCKNNHYKRIETRTRNKFPEMISLNLKFRFQIIGTFTDYDRTPKIILRKEL